jgi:DNA processing protein
MITVNQALDQNRSVMAVPGRIDSPASQGCHRLLRDGARLVTAAEDVIEELQDLLPRRKGGGDGPRAASAGQTGAKGARPQAVLSPDERAVLSQIGDEGSAVDAVVRGSGFEAGKVSALLVGLQIKRLVRLLAGGIVARKTCRAGVWRT